MKFVSQFRIPAIFCALAVLICELVSRPFANMGICDDGPYILMVQHLAATGHIAYNGWAAPMLGWQLYLGAAFIKLFGFSFTAVRMSTLLVAVAMAFLLQRAFVAANISERNATIGTLAFVLSPLYLMLSVTFMTDIFGLFAIVACLYGCLRALQASAYPSSTGRSTIAWLCFAVAANALCGTARQIAWLGVLVMVPSTLWLLRARRRVLFAGSAATLAGAFFIFACLHWLKHQPYLIPEHIFAGTLSVSHGCKQLLQTFLDIPYLLLPIAALFLPEVRKTRPRIVAALFVGYLLLAILPRPAGHLFLLEPTHGDWVGVPATFQYSMLKGTAPDFFHAGVRMLITLIAFGGLLGFIVSRLRRRTATPEANSPGEISWYQLKILLLPFAIAYILLLLPRAFTFHVTDRYTLGLLIVALIYPVRYYQDRVQPRLPAFVIVLVGIVAIGGVAITHNMFALYRARAAMAAEIRAAGVPDTSVDNGWEYNLGVELQYAAFINYPPIEIPAHAYVPTPAPPAGTCAWDFDPFPHIHALYGVSFDPNACYGPAPFAAVHYSRWLASKPGTLYAVEYTPSSAVNAAHTRDSKIP